MCAEQKAARVRQHRADMHFFFFPSLFFFLCSFCPFFFSFLSFPLLFFFSNFALLSFFRPVMVKGRKDRVTPLDPWSGGSGDGGKEGGEMSKNLTNLKSKPGEGLCVFVLMEALMEPLKYFQDFFSHLWKGGKGEASFVGKICTNIPILLQSSGLSLYLRGWDAVPAMAQPTPLCEGLHLLSLTPSNFSSSAKP